MTLRKRHTASFQAANTRSFTRAPAHKPTLTLTTKKDTLAPASMSPRHISSPSSPQRSLSGSLSAVGAKLTRAFSNDNSPIDADRQSVATTIVGSGNNASTDRSVSRGREVFHSSGRGGIGNIRQSSVSRDAPRVDGPDDFSQTRGREPAVDSTKVFSTGRGGAGNIRSPSRDAHPAPVSPDLREQEVIRSHVETDKTAVHSSGRGGLGNISRSRSRGPPSSPGIHSSGRGGAGNLVYGEAGSVRADDDERKQYIHADGVHSTGRGGAANLTSAPAPAVEHHAQAPAEYLSSGRGGAGNIRDRSASKEKHSGGGIAGLFHKVTHSHSHSQSPTRDGPPKEDVGSVTGDPGGIQRGGIL